MKRLAAAFLTIGLISVSLGGSADADSNLYSYSFRGCSWLLQIENPYPWGGTAYARTVDQNGGCHRLDADIQYRKSGSQTVYTKYCTARVTNDFYCSVGSAGSDSFRAFLYAGRGSAQDAESEYYWQHSGWKYW